MAGKRVATPVTLTNDVSKVLKSFKDISISGDSDFITACNISMLLLKHRQNKNQKQRILMFVASPVKNSVDEMVLLGKKLKKNNIAIDIISFGNTDVNHEALSQLHSNANNSNNSNLLEVQPDQYVVDCLFTSPILNDNIYENEVVNNQQPSGGENNSAPSNPAPAQGGLSQFERDINLAIQQSIEEEERRRKEGEQGKKEGEAKDNKESKPEEIKEEEEIQDEDLAAEIEKARLMSIQEHESIVKKEKETEKKIKEELIEDEDFIKGVMDEIGIKDDENKETKDDKKDSDKDK